MKRPKLRVNAALIRQWTEDVGGMGKAVKLILAEYPDMSHNTANKIASGYYISEPSKPIREALCRATGFTHDELFVSVELATV